MEVDAAAGSDLRGDCKDEDEVIFFGEIVEIETGLLDVEVDLDLCPPSSRRARFGGEAGLEGGQVRLRIGRVIDIEMLTRIAQERRFCKLLSSLMVWIA